MQIIGYSLIAIAIVGIIAGSLNLWRNKFLAEESSKRNLPKTKTDGDNIKVRFAVKDKVTVLNINKEKEVTYKGKEVTSQVNGIYSISSKDDTIFFYVAETGQLYKLEEDKLIPLEVKSHDDWDDDWDD